MKKVDPGRLFVEPTGASPIPESTRRLEPAAGAVPGQMTGIPSHQVGATLWVASHHGGR